MKTLLLLLLLALPVAAQSIKRNAATTNAVPISTYVSGVLTNASNITGGTTNNSTGFYGNSAGLTNIPAAGVAIGGTLPALNAASLTNISISGITGGLTTNLPVINGTTGLTNTWHFSNGVLTNVIAL